MGILTAIPTPNVTMSSLTLLTTGLDSPAAVTNFTRETDTLAKILTSVKTLLITVTESRKCARTTSELDLLVTVLMVTPPLVLTEPAKMLTSATVRAIPVTKTPFATIPREAMSANARESTLEMASPETAPSAPQPSAGTGTPRLKSANSNLTPETTLVLRSPAIRTR